MAFGMNIDNVCEENVKAANELSESMANEINEGKALTFGALTDKIVKTFAAEVNDGASISKGMANALSKTMAETMAQNFEKSSVEPSGETDGIATSMANRFNENTDISQEASDEISRIMASELKDNKLNKYAFNGVKDHIGLCADGIMSTLKNVEDRPVRDADVVLVNDFPGLEARNVLVCGNPLDAEQKFDFVHDNSGLVSAENFFKDLGIDVNTEDLRKDGIIMERIVPYASESVLSDTEKTNLCTLRKIIEDREINVNPCIDLDKITNFYENGSAVIIGFQMSVDNPSADSKGLFDYVVTMTGTVRDNETGELLGITVCDSNTHEPFKFISKDLLNEYQDSNDNCFIALASDAERRK